MFLKKVINTQNSPLCKFFSYVGLRLQSGHSCGWSVVRHCLVLFLTPHSITSQNPKYSFPRSEQMLQFRLGLFFCWWSRLQKGTENSFVSVDQIFKFEMSVAASLSTALTIEQFFFFKYSKAVYQFSKEVTQITGEWLTFWHIFVVSPSFLLNKNINQHAHQNSTCLSLQP